MPEDLNPNDDGTLGVTDTGRELDPEEVWDYPWCHTFPDGGSYPAICVNPACREIERLRQIIEFAGLGPILEVR